MKTKFTLSFLYILFLVCSAKWVQAGAGIYDAGIYVNGTAYSINNTSGYSGNLFNNANWGNVTNVFINDARNYTWKDGSGNICSGKLNYRIYKSGTTPGSFTTANLPWIANQGGGNQLWANTSLNINVLSGLELGETYKLEIYFSATGSSTSNSSCGGETFYLNNGGSNYTATFTYGNVYWWIGGTAPTAWSTTSAWSATKGGSAVGSITTGSNTVFIFDGSCLNTGCSITSGAIKVTHGGAAISCAKILLKNNANVTYQPGTTARSITLSGGVGTDFDIPSGSTWIALGSAHNITLSAGVTASISGTFSMGTSGSAISDFQLLGTNAGSIVFNSGSNCLINNGSGIYPFGTSATAGIVVFSSGSTLNHYSSEDVFGGSGKTVLTFNSGSIYEFDGNSGSLLNLNKAHTSVRTYSNIVFNNSGAINSSGDFGSDITCDSLIVKSTSGGNIDLQNVSKTLTIKGNLSNHTTNRVLSFTPNANGTSTTNFDGDKTHYILTSNTANGGINFGTTTASRFTYINITDKDTVILGNGVQTGQFQLSSNTAANTLFTVKTGGVLDVKTSVIYGLDTTQGGSFITESGSTVKTAHAEGLSTSTSLGSVRTQVRTYHSGANYVFNGTVAQVTGNFLASTTPALNTVNDLTIDNSSGVTIPSSTGNANINGVLYLTNGVFNTRTNNVYAIVNGTNATTSVQRSNGWVSGNLTRGIATSAVNYVFPVGDDTTNYTPATINYTSITTSGKLNIITVGSDHPQITSSEILKEADANRYWSLTNSGIVATNYTARFDYVSGDRDASATDPTIFQAGLYSSSIWSYPTGSSAAAYYVTTSTNTAYGDFVVGYRCGSSNVRVWLGAVNDNWHVAGNWQCGAVPVSSSNVVIPNVSNKPRIYTSNAVAQSILIAANSSLTMEGAYNLSLSTGATFTNNAGSTGFVATSSTGALIFLGSGTISGTSTFNNVEYYGALNFGTSSTVSGVVTIQSGGYTDTNAPTYLSGSTLKYNTGSDYYRRVEWSTTSGNGYPYNVWITNNTKVYASHSSSLSASTPLNITGDLTIDNGAQLYMDDFNGANNMTASLIVAKSINLKGNLSCSKTTGADIKLGGDWNFTVGGNFYPNSSAVYFNGSGLQIISRSSSGVLNFPYVVIENTSQGVQLSSGTSVVFYGPTGSSLQMLGTGTGNTLDLNGNSATINNNTSIKISGNSSVTSGSTSTFQISGGVGAGNVNGTGSIVFDTNVRVQLSTGFDFGASLSTIKGLLSINSGGYVSNNPPTYATGSILRYNSTGTYNRNVEWSANTGPGYPYHVEVINGTTLNLYANGGTAKSCAGNLTLGTTGSAGNLNMGTMTASLTVGGNVTIGGSTGTSTLTLGDESGINKGDIYVGGSWTRNSTGAFNPGTGNGRTVYLNSSSDGTITATGGEIFPYLYVSKATKASNITLASGITITRELRLTKGNLTLGNNDIIIRSTSDNTASVGPSVKDDVQINYTGTGKFSVERYMKKGNSSSNRRWHLLTAPFLNDGSAQTINQAWQEGANNGSRLSPSDPNPGYGTLITKSTSNTISTDGFDQGSTNNPSIYYLNAGTTSYGVPVSTSTTKITDHEGYMIFLRGDRSIVISSQYVAAKPTTLRAKGKIIVGDVTKSLQTGRNVVGNPYASAIKMNNVVYNGEAINAGQGGTYYYWDPRTSGDYEVGKFITITNDGAGNPTGWTVTANESNINDGTIQSGAAIVVISSGAPNTITFTESDKASGSSNVGIESRPVNNVNRPITKPMKVYANMFSVVSDGTYKIVDGTATLFGTGYNNEVDNYDAVKLSSFNLKEDLFLLRDGKNLAIEKRQPVTVNDTIFLQIKNLDNKKYKFSFRIENMDQYIKPYLEDMYTGVSQELSCSDSVNTVYDFAALSTDPLSKSADRFRIVFKRSAEGSPLPVRFINVSAAQQEKNISVSWSTATNQSTSVHFEVEYSADGLVFNKKSNLILSNMSNSYKWIDDHVQHPVNYYRIKQIDAEGNILYSKIVKVSVGDIGAGIKLLSSVITDQQAGIVFTNMPSGKYEVRMFNSVGQELTSLILSHAGGSTTRYVDMGNAAATGIYHLEILDPSKQKTTLRLIKK